MNDSTKVSVIIPTYNRPQLIGRALKSVLSQTYKNIEIVIIDGSPNDETERAIQPYLADSRIRYVHREEIHTNTIQDMANIAKARNRAVRMAQGKYIVPLDSDDFWVDEKKLEKQIQFLEKNSDYTLCGGGAVGIDKENPKKIFKVFILYGEKDEDVRKIILSPANLFHSTVVYRKSDWETVGGYDEEHLLGEEWDLHLKLGKIGKLYNFQEYFTCYVWGGHEREHIIKYGRNCLANGIRLIIKYRNDYPGFYKSFLFHSIWYLYTFLPRSFRKLKLLKSIAWKVQIFFYRSVGINKKRLFSVAKKL